MGWFRDLLNKIKGTKSLAEPTVFDHMEIPNTTTPMDKYIMPDGDKITEATARDYNLGIRRKDELNCLGNYSVELAKLGNTLDDNQLIQYIGQKGGRFIDVSSENRAVDLVDVKAAIILGYDIAYGHVKEDTIASLGGMNKVLDEMSKQAKETAKLNGYTPNMAGDFMLSANKSIENMLQKQQEEQQEEQQENMSK